MSFVIYDVDSAQGDACLLKFNSESIINLQYLKHHHLLYRVVFLFIVIQYCSFFFAMKVLHMSSIPSIC